MRLLQIFLLSILWSSQLFSQFNIKGKITDERNFPVSGVKVSIPGVVTSKSNDAGEFNLISFTKPYDLFIVDGSSRTSVLYSNLSIENPELILFGVKNSRNTYIEPLKVTFPEIPYGRSAIVKFISEDVFYSAEVISASGETTKLLTIEWPKYSSTLNGKVIYLEREQLEFTRFGEKTITTQSTNPNQSVKFTDADFNRNPGSSTIYLSFPILKYELKGYDVLADFLAFNRTSEFKIAGNNGDIVSTKVLVPSSLPFSYRLKVRGYGFGSDGSGFENIVFAYPGTSYNLEELSHPVLLAPQNNLIGYNKNTLFAFESGSGAGIYLLRFTSFYPEGNFYVVTTDKNFINPVERSGGVLDGNEFKWRVMKYSPFSSVDDFVKQKLFANDMGFKQITISPERTFKINAY